MTRLAELKTELYSLLLSTTKDKSEDEISDSDVNIMYELAGDLDVQNCLKEQKEYEESRPDCPECDGKLISLWSGVKCSKCNYWFCY